MTKKDKSVESLGTNRPLTSLLWVDAPSEMSRHISGKGRHGAQGQAGAVPL